MLLIVVGVFFVGWSLWFRGSMARLRGRVAERGGDLARFDGAMAPWIRYAPPLVGGLGVVLVLAGVLELA